MARGSGEGFRLNAQNFRLRVYGSGLSPRTSGLGIRIQRLELCGSRLRFRVYKVFGPCRPGRLQSSAFGVQRFRDLGFRILVRVSRFLGFTILGFEVLRI